MFIKSNSILINISTKQWSSLLNELTHKLMTPFSTIDTTSALPHASQPKLSSQLGRCAPSKIVYWHHGVHHREYLAMQFYYYLILYFNVKLITKTAAQINVLTIFYITVMHVLSFGSLF